MSSKRLGAIGEDIAGRYLEDRGLKLMEKNYRCGLGEVDLIAYDGEYLIFVEVKTRTSTAYGFPVEAVGPRKRDKYYQIASVYIKEKGLNRIPIRFDIIEVMVYGGGKPSINHIPNAFRPSGGKYYL